MNEASTPRFLQGVFPFEGTGLDTPAPLDDTLSYTVPAGTATQPLYFRAGNSSDELIYLCLVRDGVPMRYFPIAARGSSHVSLRVVEDLLADTRLEVFVAAPTGTRGHAVVDVGMVEF